MKVLITGGNRGLGLELVKKFSAMNHEVIAIVRNKVAEQQLKYEVSGCHVLCADITKVNQLTELTELKNIQVDLLINNAGAGSSGVSIEDTETKEIENQLQVHCIGAFNMTQHVLSALKKSKTPQIINISSRLGSMSRNAKGEFMEKGFSYSYRIAKAAQNMLTQCLAQELGAKGFRVCALHPGRLLTSSGASDAHMTASESALKIYGLVESNQIENGKYYCVETGEMEW